MSPNPNISKVGRVEDETIEYVKVKGRLRYQEQQRSAIAEKQRYKVGTLCFTRTVQSHYTIIIDNYHNTASAVI